MPSPVRGSVAAAASPTKRARPPAATSVARSTWAGMGHALWGPSGRASGPSTSRTWARSSSSGQRLPISWVVIRPPRWMPKPTLAPPPATGNDQA